jgi:hypothetical protein
MDPSHRRTHVTVVLVAALVFVAALAAACSAQATSGAAASPTNGGSGARPSSAPSSADTTPASAKGADGDWTRVLNALGYMQKVPPTRPVVVLLGGSAARESTISDADWRDQIVAKGGPATLAWNMGSRNRTMAQNLAIVKKLPAGAHAIVYVGINLGAFTSNQKTASITLPSPLPTESPSLDQPHQYGTKTTGILSTGQKKAAVQAWLADRYPVFKANIRTSSSVLGQLLALCRKRGYKAVLFELPRNTQVIGSSLGAPTADYRDKCKALAAKYHVPWVSFVSAAKLPNQDFYDLWHLVEPGRTVWQGLLSAKTAALLRAYGFDGGGS